MKWRNCKERELLSSGGTREQTLSARLNQKLDLQAASLENHWDCLEADGDASSPFQGIG